MPKDSKFCPFTLNELEIGICKIRNAECIFFDLDLKACRLKILVDKVFEIVKDMEKKGPAASPLSALGAIFGLMRKK